MERVFDSFTGDDQFGRSLIRASCRPIARLSASRERTLHRVTLDGSDVVHRHEGFDTKLDIVPIYGPFNRSRLAWTFEGSAKLISILLQIDLLIRSSCVPTELDSPWTSHIRISRSN
jgi:hypothetical protein